MTKWIDLALMADERGLDDAMQRLSPTERHEMIADAAGVLGISEDMVQRAALRILVERARPFALPTGLWSRSVTSSDDPRIAIQSHFANIGVEDTPERIEAAMALYFNFTEETRRYRVQERDLQRCGFRCQHCGVAFCNEQLADKDFESPFGNRGASKSDPLKPHWQPERLSDLAPSMDHEWPVSLYGPDRLSNLRVLCKGCNAGKAQYLALEQYPSWVGRPERKQLLGRNALPFETFYVQLRRFPACARTGRQARECELTVVMRDPAGPRVLDNLVTVESPGL